MLVLKLSCEQHIYKAFDRVWQEGLLFKVRQKGISGELITLIKDFLSCRKQGVVLNGQHSSGQCLSHLRYHKFRNNFQDYINPIRVCDLEIETTTHFLLHCLFFQSAIQSLLHNIKKIDESILEKHEELITKILLYGDDKFDLSCNKSIIFSTIEFIVSTERFSNSLV